MISQIAKYRIVGELGKGGMGVVYRGIDPVIGRTVAIKTIRLDVFTHPAGRQEAQKRFIREAQAAGNLSHPNIVTIYDVGEDKGLIYIAMEYINGCSLSDLIGEGRSIDEILRLVEQIADGLDYAHRRGIVHRDIKPGNILIGENQRVYIVDFGVARMSDSSITQSGMLMGTPRYMSPEQIAGKKVDSRADIFSLGAILYELLTRKNPFEGKNITTVIYKIMHEEVPPLHAFNKDLPAGFDRVVRKALAREPADRFATCRQLVDELKRHAGSPETSPSGIGNPTSLAVGTRIRKVLSARKAPLVLGGAILALTLLFLILVLGGRRTPPAGPVPAGPVLSTSVPAEKSSVPAPSPTRRRESPPPKADPVRRETVAPVAAPPPRKEIPETPTISGAVPEEKSYQNSKGFTESVLFLNTVMVHIPPGEFRMGSGPGEGDDDEHPLHKLLIGGFWLSKYEVTFAQYDRFAGEAGRPLPADDGWGRGERPVIRVSWDDAQAYCRWLSAKTGRTFRLPTEAEWEKAARFKFPWGSADPDGRRANFKKAADGHEHTAPVGSFPKGISFYGILDMAGNVWEWVGDRYDARYYRISPAANPEGPAEGPERVVRGGSWDNSASFIRSANRSSEKPESRLNILGFRVAMDEKLP